MKWRFGTHYRFHLHRQVNEIYFIHLPMKMEPMVSSETSAIRIQTPGNYPKRNKLHLEHGESLKTRLLQLKSNKYYIFWVCVCSLNPLTPKDHHSDRTAPLNSKRFILYIYSTNTSTEYFKHGIYSPFFSSLKCSLFHRSNVFGCCIIHNLYTGCTKIKKIIVVPKA